MNSHKPIPEETQKKYRDYLEKRFAHLELTQEEWDRIIIKIDANIFGSLDVDIEGSILLLNALEEVKTRHSCADHQKRLIYKDRNMCKSFFGYYTNEYEKTRPLTDSIAKIAHSDTDSVSVYAQDQDKARNVHVVFVTFTQKPSKEWQTYADEKTDDRVQGANDTLTPGYSLIPYSKIYGASEEAQTKRITFLKELELTILKEVQKRRIRS